jgi:hypothetical protein
VKSDASLEKSLSTKNSLLRLFEDEFLRNKCSRMPPSVTAVWAVLSVRVVQSVPYGRYRSYVSVLCTICSARDAVGICDSDESIPFPRTTTNWCIILNVSCFGRQELERRISLSPLSNSSTQFHAERPEFPWSYSSIPSSYRSLHNPLVPILLDLSGRCMEK